MNTWCRDCVFNISDGDVQTGCDVDRLSKFKEVGTEIETMVDGGKEFFVILGRICNYCHNEEALKDVPARKRREFVENRIKVKVNLGVYVGPDDTFEKAKLTLDSIGDQTLPAHEVTVILHGGHDASDYVTYFTYDDDPLPWSVVEITDDEAETYERAMDIAMENIKSTYYSVSHAGYIYRNDYISTINTAINEKMLRFVALTPDESGDASLVQRGLHKLLGGNRGDLTVFQKLEEVASIEGTSAMIKRFEDIS